MVTIAYLNFWPRNRNDIQDNWFTHFFNANFGGCTVVNPNDNPDVLICSCFGNIGRVTQVTAKCKLFFYGENLNRYHPYNTDKLLYDTFDLIVGFKRTDAAKKQIRLPLWVIYYNYYKYDEGDNILTRVTAKYNKNIKVNKDMLGSLVCNHDRGGQRVIMLNELEKYGSVITAGKFKNNMHKNIGRGVEDKINFISTSVFNICPENSAFEGYCTEKIFHALEGGSIPLYWGVDLPEKDIINQDKYCFCNMHGDSTVEVQNISVQNISAQIEAAYTNKDKYIEADLFNKDANMHLKNFYDELVTGVQQCIVN
jgi:alpha(1,3/1,4) fucosyltransferase